VTTIDSNRRMRENRMSGGVGGVTGEIPLPRPVRNRRRSPPQRAITGLYIVILHRVATNLEIMGQQNPAPFNRLPENHLRVQLIV